MVQVAELRKKSMDKVDTEHLSEILISEISQEHQDLLNACITSGGTD